jgi:cytoskeletal protein CcmA (bactofilin family)
MEMKGTGDEGDGPNGNGWMYTGMLSGRRNMPVTSQLGTTIGRSVTIKGDIRSEEDLLIDGQVEGTLDLGQHRLVVGPNAQVRARITAREVEVQGVVNGNVEAVERITLRKNSKVVGDLKMAGVVIEDGANFKGNIDITRSQVATPPPPTVIAKHPDLPSAG